MSPRSTFPYDTRLDIRFGPLEHIDVRAMVDAVTHPWYNETLCRVKDSVVRHRTRAPERTIMPMVEPATMMPSGSRANRGA